MNKNIDLIFYLLKNKIGNDKVTTWLKYFKFGVKNLKDGYLKIKGICIIISVIEF